MIWQRTAPNGPWAPPNKALNCANTTDFISIPSSTTTAIPSLFTVALWVNPSSLPALRRIARKAPWQFIMNGTTGFLRMFIARGTANTDYIASNNPVVAGVQNFIAATFNPNAASGEIVNLYRGGLGVPATECSYGTATDGSGTITDTGVALHICRDADSNAGLAGIYPFFALFPSVLNLRDIRSLQETLRPPKQASVVMYLGDTATGTQVDCSGNNNHGTVNGATPAPGLPLFEYPNPARLLAS